MAKMGEGKFTLIRYLDKSVPSGEFLIDADDRLITFNSKLQALAFLVHHPEFRDLHIVEVPNNFYV